MYNMALKNADIIQQLIRATFLDATQEFGLQTTSWEATIRKLLAYSQYEELLSPSSHHQKFMTATHIKASEEGNQKPHLKMGIRDNPLLYFNRRGKSMDWLIGRPIYNY